MEEIAKVAMLISQERISQRTFEDILEIVDVPKPHIQ